MTDELAPFFETRETRNGRLPEEARGKFEMAEKQAVANGQTDFADRQFVSLWLSRRTGMPRRDIIANFDNVAGRYFGQGTTAAGAWDKIAANYKPAEGEGAGDAGASQDAEYAATEGLPKVGAAALMENVDQSGRAVAGGFTGFAQKVPAGLYSQASAVTGVRLKDPMEDPDYRAMKRQSEGITNPGKFTQVYDEAMSFGPVPDEQDERLLTENEKKMSAIRQRIDAENREAVKTWHDSTKGQVSEEYRRLASFWYDLSEGASERMGVNEDFQRSTLGQFMASAGSVPATAALAVMGPGGWVGMESAFFADVEGERMQAEGASYDPVKALPANLASTMPQVFLERAFGVERLMNTVLGEMPKLAGRITFGDFAKQFVRRGLEAGVEEGITEPTQNFWNDFMASQTYDEKRELFTPEAAKKRLVESVTAFTLGFVFGGGVTSVETIDQNRAVKKGAEYLTTKDGQPLTPEDFSVLRQVKSDSDLAATAPDEESARILVAAANGDTTAQAAYNQRVMNTLFVNTDGVEVNGMALGTVQGVPVMRMGDGQIMSLDMADPEDRAFVDNFKREAVRQVALNETTDFLKKGLEEGRKIEVSDQERTLRDFVTEAKIDVDEAAKRIGIASDVNGANIPEGTKPEDVRVLGANIAEYQAGVYRDVSHVFAGGNALTAIEEVAEGYIKKRLAVGDVFEDELKTWRDKYEADTGTKTATAGTVSNIEWFSKRVVDYAVANRKAPGMPKSWTGFFRTLGEHLKSVFRLSERLKKLKRDGKLGEDFEGALKGALGMVGPDEAFAGLRQRDAARMDQGNREAAPVASELDAEMMSEAQAADTFPKIEGNVDDGFTVSSPTGESIGSAQTLEQAQDRAVQWFYDQARAEERGQAVADAGLADASNELQNVIRQRGGLLAPSQEPVFGGELRAMAENLTTGQKLRLFRKNGLSLDALRESLREDGFEFDTINDLLDALEKSTRGAPVFPTTGGESQVTFSTARAKPADASNQVRLPDGTTMVGPTTFSLTAYHGTPHKVDKFKTANIGTGEGAQAYGWGLYFAQSRAVGVQYKTALSSKAEARLRIAQAGEVIEPEEGSAQYKAAKLINTNGDKKAVALADSEEVKQAIEALRYAMVWEERGNLYTVELMPDEADFLDWDAPLSEQSEKVKAALDSAEFNQEATEFSIGFPDGSETGESMYRGIVEAFVEGGKTLDVAMRRASQFLVDLGVPGIRYLDGGSRSVGEGTRNFVVFDEKLVRILEENGRPVPKRQASNEDITFATTGIPQNGNQALAMQAAKLLAKKRAATATFIARINAGQPLPARAKLVRRSTQASILAKLGMPVSARLQRISTELAQRLRRFEFDLGKATSRDFQAVQPFMKGFESMKDADARVLDLALKNGDTQARDTILANYGLQAEFATVVQVIESARQRGIAAGYEVGQIEDYFPRKVNDLDGLMTHYYGKPQGGVIEQALVAAEKKAQAQGRVLSPEERIEVVNQALQGMRRPSSKPSNFKERRTDVVDPDADRFYADSIQALASYIESVNQAVEKRRFFGKFAVNIQAANGGTFASNRLALEASIGAYVEDLIAQGKISRSQQAEVQGVLEARFTQGVTSQFIKNFKALSYLGTMGQITSAITQITDLAFSLYENGVFDTIVAAGEAVARKSKVTREQLGLDNMAEEFRDVGKLHQILNLTFKAVGIHYLDLIGKETLVNGKFRQMQRQAQAGQLSTRNAGIIQSSFGPKSAQVIADLAAGNKTSDTLFAVYTVLADFQPISLSEYPEAYLRHPNGRVFYMLKTFTLKQIEAFRRESFSLIAKGSAKQKAVGFRNLAHLSAMLFLAGLPLDWLKDWIMGRDPQLSDLAVDNLFKLLGVNRWNLWQFRYRKNPLEAAMLLIVPPAPFIQYPLLDAENVAKKIAAGDEIEPGNFESWRIFPFIGAPIYWWTGGGEEKIEEQRKKRDARGRVGDR